jgi:hypothetical protein
MSHSPERTPTAQDAYRPNRFVIIIIYSTSWPNRLYCHPYLQSKLAKQAYYHYHHTLKIYVIDVNMSRTPEKAPTAQVGQTGLFLPHLQPRLAEQCYDYHHHTVETYVIDVNMSRIPEKAPTAHIVQTGFFHRHPSHAECSLNRTKLSLNRAKFSLNQAYFRHLIIVVCVLLVGRPARPSGGDREGGRPPREGGGGYAGAGGGRGGGGRGGGAPAPGGAQGRQFTRANAPARGGRGAGAGRGRGEGGGDGPPRRIRRAPVSKKGLHQQ